MLITLWLLIAVAISQPRSTKLMVINHKAIWSRIKLTTFNNVN